ncbi:FKBP-type peptidyl-prolyl cis-trans isomerase [uncultured Meiothermus sp.]|uniref:FKBP-type peptidyl-prolyl cis-trans isomerase n=1 Tax=uncultured Meiothermus sp. TaxID=157471 RepID=UPI0026237643|nr:FKBP-type peptidyl-prolyl cis-trans isomerase [uncultured Meiothermus sp.]
MNRNLIFIIIAVSALLGAGAFLLFGQRTPQASVGTGTLCANQPAAATGLTNEGITTLRLEDTREGLGPQAMTANTVRLQYIGRLVDGTQFDTSCQPGRTPFEFTLGAGQVIPGWDSGIVGMRVGGQRRLIIPAHLAYGERSPSPDIPPNSALIFDVELLEIR